MKVCFLFANVKLKGPIMENENHKTTIGQFKSVACSFIFCFLHFSEILFSNTSIKPALYDEGKIVTTPPAEVDTLSYVPIQT